MLANITSIPRTTIFTADVVADCFKVTPRNAPSKKSSKTPVRIDAVTEYVWGKTTNGKSRTRDARADVVAVTIPDPRALRLILPTNLVTLGCSVVIGAGFFLFPLFSFDR